MRIETTEPLPGEDADQTSALRGMLFNFANTQNNGQNIFSGFVSGTQAYATAPMPVRATPASSVRLSTRTYR